MKLEPIRHDPSFGDVQPAQPVQHHYHHVVKEPQRSWFASLPWIVRWAIYVLCLGVLLPPLLWLGAMGFGAYMLTHLK